MRSRDPAVCRVPAFDRLAISLFVTSHRVARPGRHTVKFWALDPGLVPQRLVVDAGWLRPSYLGPPESPYRPAREVSGFPAARSGPN
jgi:hypothetical protein